MHTMKPRRTSTLEDTSAPSPAFPVVGEAPVSSQRPQLSLATARAAESDRAMAKAEAAPGTTFEPRLPAQEEPRAKSAAAAEVASARAEVRGGSRRKMVLAGIGLVAILAGGWYGYRYWTVGRFIVSTDDAYVGANMAMISSKVAANIAEVPVTDNQVVKVGDVLVRLDDGDYQLALDQATTKLATQRSAIATYDAQIAAAVAAAGQARAQLDSNRASLVKAEADFTRTDTLAARDYSSKSTLDAARAARDSAKAQVSAQQAAIESANANIAVLKAQKAQAEQLAKELEVAVAKAQRDLSFTVIRAPVDGVVGNRSMQVGDYVTPGKRLAAVVPLDKVYVDANLKETQLPRVSVGETAKVRIDALDGEAIIGKVESVAPASGSQFSLLPPENATGNFTKIVQRVPVRIAIDAKDAAGKLRPGLSVIVDIDTRTHSKTTPNSGAVASK